MPRWECRLTSQRDDGAFTWKRVDADSPKGHLAPELVPTGAVVGSLILIEATTSMGHVEVHACHLIGPSGDVDESSTLSRNVAVEKYPPPIPDGLESGQLRWAVVRNPLEDPDSSGKIRPVVLVSSDASSWRVMGLTTKQSYSTGGRRVPIRNWTAVGLSGPGFLWGNRLTRITIDSVKGFLGWSDDHLADSIIELASGDLTPNEVEDLRTSAHLHSAPLITSRRHNSLDQPSLHLSVDSLASFFKRRRDVVIADLSDYFGSGRYTGRDFETYSAMSSRVWFDGNDIAAVMSLSVQLKPHIPSSIYALRDGCKIDFSTVHRDTPMWAMSPDRYEPGGLFADVWNLLIGVPDVGRTIASKLMASKFPHAIPIQDRDVAQLLGNPDQWWLGWYDVFQHKPFRTQLEAIRDEISLHHVSLLRIADVALWIEAQRQKSLGSPQ